MREQGGVGQANSLPQGEAGLQRDGHPGGMPAEGLPVLPLEPALTSALPFQMAA
jgi:hypothetical protein